MKANTVVVPTLLSLANLVYVSAIASPNPVPTELLRADYPKLNSLLPRQQSSTAATPSSRPPYSPTTPATPPTTTIGTSNSSPIASTPAPPPPSPTTTFTPPPPPPPPPPSSTTLSTSVPPPATTSSRTKNHNIAVGYNSTQFTPTTLKSIPPGDTLTFYFYPTNYSIIQSSFSAPCQPISLPDSSPGTSGSNAGNGNAAGPGGNGLFSGWTPTSPDGGIARSKFVVTVPNTDTMWIYAFDGSRNAVGEKTVCELGMAMVVNPRPKIDGTGTLGQYRKAAAGLRGSASGTQEERGKVIERIGKVPGDVAGGEVKGVSEREKGRWEGRHPWPVVGSGFGNSNGTVGDGDGDGVDDGDVDKDVAKYRNGAAGTASVWDKGRGWVGILVILEVGMVGLLF